MKCELKPKNEPVNDVYGFLEIATSCFGKTKTWVERFLPFFFSKVYLFFALSLKNVADIYLFIYLCIELNK